ncbi:PH domain-containing protein [Halocatena marina]|uniref:PH domain-containing protein n=1 Tax=Halocatena marina TaxID=2934937 RepID=A0ABD5YVR7_9EURY|nr:PH domain-containing protein [Halocatena marina]
MKLHPLSAVWNAFRRGIGGALFPFFLLVIGQSFDFVSFSLLFVLLPVGFILGAGYGIAYYLQFEYELTEDTFDVTSGVLNRQHREIPFRRIQNIDVTQSFIQRLLGFAVVRLETAGGGETEAELNFIDRAEAARLQSTIRDRKRAVTKPTDSADRPLEESSLESDDAGSVSTILFELRLTELAFLAIAFLRPGALLIVPLGLPFGEDLAISLLLTLSRPFGGPAELSPTTLTPDAIVVLFLVGLPLAILGAWIASALFTFIEYFGFELRRIDNDLVYERGLLRRYSGTIPVEKIQTLTISEPVLARPLGYAGLTVETAGYAPGQSQSGETESAIPLTHREHMLKLARAIEPFEELTFTRSPKLARRRYTVRYLLLIAALVGLGYLGFRFVGFSYWYAPAVLLPLAPIAAHYKWKHRGYCVGENHIVLRDGFWRRTTRVVPYYRLQTVLTRSNIFQRRLGLATVTADTASSATLLGGGATAYDIDSSDAQRLHTLLRERLQQRLLARS